MKSNLEDFLNEELLDIKPKKNKSKKKIEWKETDTEELLEQDEKKEKENEGDKEEDSEDTRSGEEDDNEPKVGSRDDEKKKDAPKIKPKKPKHEPQGKKVMEISLSLSGEDYGNVEIGDEEYAAITGLSSLLSFYDIDARKVADASTATESLTLTVKEIVSQVQNNVSLMMRTNIDDTLSINILVNEMGQPFSDMTQAIDYFNNQYQTHILNTINREIR